MSKSTQITGITANDTKRLGIEVLIDNLQRLGYSTSLPPRLLGNRQISLKWKYHDELVQFFDHIKTSTLHIVINEHELTELDALTLLYAMHKQKPIILSGDPHFDKQTPPFLKELISLHTNNLYAINLLKLEFAELSYLTNKMKPAVNYSLSDPDVTTIKSAIRHYFQAIVKS